MPATALLAPTHTVLRTKAHKGETVTKVKDSRAEVRDYLARNAKTVSGRAYAAEQLRRGENRLAKGKGISHLLSSVGGTEGVEALFIISLAEADEYPLLRARIEDMQANAQDDDESDDA